MSSNTNALLDATSRFLGTGALGSVFSGVTLATVLPVVMIVVFTVLIISLVSTLLADSPGPYAPFGRRVAGAAADLWNTRHQYGNVLGRSLDNLGPLEEILDALATSVQRYDSPAPNVPKGKSFQFPSAPNFSGPLPTNLIRSGSLHPTKEVHRQSPTGKVRFE